MPRPGAARVADMSASSDLVLRPAVDTGPRLLDSVYASLPEGTERVAIEHFTINESAGRFYEREGFAVERVEDAASGDPRQRVTWRVKGLR